MPFQHLLLLTVITQLRVHEMGRLQHSKTLGLHCQCTWVQASQRLPGRMPASLKTASLLASPEAPPAAQKSNWCTCKPEKLLSILFDCQFCALCIPLSCYGVSHGHEAHVARQPFPLARDSQNLYCFCKIPWTVQLLGLLNPDEAAMARNANFHKRCCSVGLPMLTTSL